MCISLARVDVIEGVMKQPSPPALVLLLSEAFDPVEG